MAFMHSVQQRGSGSEEEKEQNEKKTRRAAYLLRAGRTHSEHNVALRLVSPELGQ